MHVHYINFLHYPFSWNDEIPYVNIAQEASIYRWIGPHNRLVQMLGHYRKSFVLQYMKNCDLKTYLQI